MCLRLDVSLNFYVQGELCVRRAFYMSLVHWRVVLAEILRFATSFNKLCMFVLHYDKRYYYALLSLNTLPWLIKPDTGNTFETFNYWTVCFYHNKNPRKIITQVVSSPQPIQPIGREAPSESQLFYPQINYKQKLHSAKAIRQHYLIFSVIQRK